jgi:hypothetical protein
MKGAVFGQGIEPFHEYKEKGTGIPVSEVLGSLHEHLYENSAFYRNAGFNCGIDSCHFYNIGMGAISLSGGERVKLVNGGNFVTNSKIHDFNRLGKTYRTAINIDGCGNIVKNNEIYNAEHAAIYIHGNNHLIEENYIHDCCTDTEDMGAIYMGRDPSEAGTIIRNNFFAAILPAKKNYRVAAIFLDDGASYTTIENNIFWNCGDSVFGAIFASGGQFLMYSNNVFINCEKGIGYYIWDNKRWTNYHDNDIWQQRLYKSVNIKTEPYYSQYPGLATNLRDQANPPVIKNSIFINCAKPIEGNLNALNSIIKKEINGNKLDIYTLRTIIKTIAEELGNNSLLENAIKTIEHSNNAGNPNSLKKNE